MKKKICNTYNDCPTWKVLPSSNRYIIMGKCQCDTKKPFLKDTGDV